MDIALMILATVLVIAGLIGCFLPIIPGPPLSYVGLLFLHFTDAVQFPTFTLVVTGIAMVVVTILDFLIPSWSTKKFGGTKWGIRGCSIGLIIGLFLGTVWVFVCPFAGALIGELLYARKKVKEANSEARQGRPFKAAFGAFLGLLCGIFIKLAYSCFVLFIVIKELIMIYAG